MKDIVPTPSHLSLDGNEEFFARSRKSRNSAEAWQRHAAQGILKIDAEIAEKDRFH
jgi:hypothetical protein